MINVALFGGVYWTFIKEKFIITGDSKIINKISLGVESFQTTELLLWK